MISKSYREEKKDNSYDLSILSSVCVCVYVFFSAVLRFPILLFKLFIIITATEAIVHYF